MTMTLTNETLEQEVVRLRRELAHVQEQSRIAHAMEMNFRERYRMAEQARIRLERRLQKRLAKAAVAPPEHDDSLQQD